MAGQVFDDKATFAEWFSDALGKQGAGQGGGPDEWLETEKRVVVIHRLHQILEPFMLRRQVQDVEGKLPPKVRAPREASFPSHAGSTYNLNIDKQGCISSFKRASCRPRCARSRENISPSHASSIFSFDAGYMDVSPPAPLHLCWFSRPVVNEGLLSHSNVVEGSWCILKSESRRDEHAVTAIVCLAVSNDDGHLKNSDCWNLCLRASACAQVPVVVKVPMVPYQSTLYKWVKATGTKRLEPESMRPGSSRTYATLSNKCMELRKVITSLLTSPFY